MRLALSMYLFFTLMSFNLNGQSLKQNDENTLHVEGVAILKQLPEVISVGISIKLETSEYTDCHNKLMAVTQKAKEIFISKGIEEKLIKTNEFRVTESKVYKNGSESGVVFIGNASFLIETPYSVEFTSKLLSGLMTDSISFSYTIAFKLSEDQKKRLRKEAISMAIDDAEEKAVLIAESSKIKLGKIRSIVYKDDGFVSGANDSDIIRENLWRSEGAFYSYGSAGNNNSNIDFNPREIRIVKAVEIEWEINDKE